MTDWEKHLRECLHDVQSALKTCNDAIVRQALNARRKRLLSWLADL